MSVSNIGERAINGSERALWPVPFGLRGGGEKSDGKTFLFLDRNGPVVLLLSLFARDGSRQTDGGGAMILVTVDNGRSDVESSRRRVGRRANVRRVLGPERLRSHRDGNATCPKERGGEHRENGR